MQERKLALTYRFALQQVLEAKWPGFFTKSLPYIPGSNVIFNIDNLDYICSPITLEFSL
jgi:hypothetical protein